MDEMFITCVLDIVDPKRELSPQAVIKLVEEKFTSTNTARDEICGNDICEYCVKHGKCFGTQHFPKCFVGRKLSPVA